LQSPSNVHIPNFGDVYAGSRINFRTTFPTHISKREFKNEIFRSALLDIQLTLFCVCGVDSFLPELEHLWKNVFTVSFPKRRVQNLGVRYGRSSTHV